MAKRHWITKPAIRAACYGFAVVQVLMLGLGTAIVIASLGPDPGDNMALMGLVVLALPMSAVSLILLLLPMFAYPFFSTRERWVFAGLGSCFLLVFVTLYLLG